MPELAKAIAEVSEASQRVAVASNELEKARGDLRKALRKAHDAGASYAFLAKVIGTSRQYVTRLIAGA